jgi:hypothetical protein
MRMKRLFGLLLMALVLGAAFAELLFPQLLRAHLVHRITERTGAQQVEVQAVSSPEALLLLGQIDQLSAQLSRGRIGEVPVAAASLSGQDIRLDMLSYLRGGGIALTRAGDLTFTAVVTEEGLKDVLQRKASRIEDLAVRITPSGITATGSVKVFGRKAEVEMQAELLTDGGGLQLHVTHLAARNLPAGREARLGSLIGDIPLVKREKLPPGCQIDGITMQDGKSEIQASYHVPTAEEKHPLAPYMDE